MSAHIPADIKQSLGPSGSTNQLGPPKLCPGPPRRVPGHPAWFLWRVGTGGWFGSPEGGALEQMKQRDAVSRTWECSHCLLCQHARTDLSTCPSHSGWLKVLNHCFRYWLRSDHVDSAVEVFPEPWVLNNYEVDFWYAFTSNRRDFSPLFLGGEGCSFVFHPVI